MARHRSARARCIYELHVGTFTPEGTLARRDRASSPHLRDLGITVIEVMPVAEFPGRFGWGYDGVNLFAPYAPLRRRPTTSARFVDARTRSASA